MRCSNCGSPIKEGAKFCGKCGQQVKQVQQPLTNSHRTNSTKRQPQSNGGKYSAAQPVRTQNKQKSGGAWVVGVLIALIVALLCVIVFVILPMFGGGKRTKEESRDVSSLQLKETNPAEAEKQSSFLDFGQTTQTIYVVDGSSSNTGDSRDSIPVYTYEFSEDGLPICYHLGYTDNSQDATTTYYVYDYDGFAEELVKFRIEASSLSDSERERREEKYSAELKKVLKKHSIDPESGLSYAIFGIKDDLVVAEFLGSINRLIKYNSQGQQVEQVTYWDDRVTNTISRSYLNEDKIHSITVHNTLMNYYQTLEYSYGTDEQQVKVTITERQDDRSEVTYYTYTYDDNNLLVRTVDSEGAETRYLYHYKKLEVPADSVASLCRIYDYAGIKYIVDEDVSVTDTLTEAEMEAATAEPVDWQGTLHLSFVKDRSGFYVKYPDGSFDMYEGGSPLIWEGPDPMTYGADYTPEHLIMDNYDVTGNKEIIQKGELVFVCPYDNRVRSGLVPVEYSGMTLSRTNEDGKKEAVFISKYDSGQINTDLWIRGKRSIYNTGFNVNTINGIDINEYGENFEYTGYYRYLSLPKGEKYTLGIVSGASLVETTYYADSTYFFQKTDVTPYELKLKPTVDGYATFDFSGIPAGEYVLYYSYWDDDDGRTAYTTYVTVH